MSNVTVVDSVMGSGKTTWAIQFMNAHPEMSFIYCTPYLDEVERIKKATNRSFYTPIHKNGGRKIDDFNTLLMDGCDIVLTHATFANATDETLEYIKRGEYHLILDEVLDILIEYNKVCNDSISKGDIKMLINESFISANEYGKVTWLKDSYPDSKYAKVERVAKNGNLFYLDNSMLVWQFPPDIFRQFVNVYILTYLFDGSFLKPYFEYHRIPYGLASVHKSGDEYVLSDWVDDKKVRNQYKQHIHIWDNQEANSYNASALCVSWYERQKKKAIERLQNHVYNFIRNIANAKSSDVMWTAPKTYQNQLKGRGYTVVRNMTREEKELPREQREAIGKKLKCFVSCNARATNDYEDRTVLAYLFNMYVNPFVKRYFENKNKMDHTEIAVNQDLLALSCMLQWIWRSGIRKPNPADIDIYIPSTRMRKLLIDWFNGNI